MTTMQYWCRNWGSLQNWDRVRGCEVDNWAAIRAGYNIITSTSTAIAAQTGPGILDIGMRPDDNLILIISYSWLDITFTRICGVCFTPASSATTGHCVPSHVQHCWCAQTAQSRCQATSGHVSPRYNCYSCPSCWQPTNYLPTLSSAHICGCCGKIIWRTTTRPPDQLSLSSSRYF